MTTMVTGAAGHLGANLVRALLARGETVRVLSRRGSPSPALAGLDAGIELVTGDIEDPRSLDAGLRGCDRLYHLAALVSIVPRDRQRLFATNVLGTRNVVQAALRAGVRRVVHCSSLGAVGASPTGASDEHWTVNPFQCMDYDLTKLLAEQEVLKAVARGLDAVIVNPSGIVGPLDFRPSLLGQTLLDVARGKLLAYVPGAVDLVPMAAVVQGHLSAMERGRAGERYILAGELVTLDQLIGWVAELTGARRPWLRVPPRLVYPYVHLKDWVERSFLPGVTPRYTVQTLKLLRHPKRGDWGKAARELGYQPRPVREALAEAIEWFRSAGYLDRRPLPARSGPEVEAA